MAVLEAMADAGLTDAFDHVFGSSAGAINGAYFLAGQASEGVAAYTDDLNKRGFVNFWRLRRIVDIDFLVSEVLKGRKALDLQRVKGSSSVLHVILTDYLTGEPRVVTNRDNGDFLEVLRATSALPILYNRVVDVDGRGAVDGGVLDAVPLFRAIELGCKDIVVVLTKQPTTLRTRPGLLLRLVETPFLRTYPATLKRVLLREDELYNTTMEAIRTGKGIPPDVTVTTVYPSDLKRLVGRTTKDRERLLECARMARRDAKASLRLGERNRQAL